MQWRAGQERTSEIDAETDTEIDDPVHETQQGTPIIRGARGKVTGNGDLLAD